MKLLIAAALIALSLCPTTNADSEQVTPISTQISDTDRQQAQSWQLSTSEWEQYRSLMNGPRGTWTPHLDPLTVLGVNAKTDQERRRYAELLVRQEKRRAEGELAFQKAYDDAFKRLYPNLPLVSAIPPLANAQSPATALRLALFVSPRCESCDLKVKDTLAQSNPVDIYMVGSKGDDEVIRTWARKIRIDPKLIQSRQLTLNHDDGRWFDLQGLSGELPGLFRREGERWLPVQF